MNPIQLGTRYYKDRSLPASNQNLINMYITIKGNDAKTKVTAHAKPGRTLFGAIGSSGSVRGSIIMDGILYVVVDTTLYSVNSAGVETSIGTIPGSVKVRMSVNLVSQLCITNGTTTLYVYDTVNGLQSVALAYPAYTCIHADGYIIFEHSGRNTWGITSNTDATSIDTTETGATNSDEDKALGIAKTSSRVFVFCEKSVEGFYVTTNFDFPYQKDRGSSFSIGCLARDTIATLDETIFWLGSDREIYKLAGLQYQRISDESISYAIQGMTTVSDASGFCFKYASKTLYQITFPTENKTFVYDANLGIWYQWGQFSNGSFIEEKVGGYIEVYNKRLFTGLADYNIYALDDTVYTDNGDTIRWQMDLPPIHANQETFEINQIVVSMETGVGLATGQGSDPVLQFSISPDAQTLGDEEVMIRVGPIGEYNYGVYYNLGYSFPDAAYMRMSGTDPVKWALNGVYFD